MNAYSVCEGKTRQTPKNATRVIHALVQRILALNAGDHLSFHRPASDCLAARHLFGVGWFGVVHVDCVRNVEVILCLLLQRIPGDRLKTEVIYSGGTLNLGSSLSCKSDEIQRQAASENNQARHVNTWQCGGKYARKRPARDHGTEVEMCATTCVSGHHQTRLACKNFRSTLKFGADMRALLYDYIPS